MRLSRRSVSLDTGLEDASATLEESLAIRFERGAMHDAYEYSIYKAQRIDAGKALGYPLGKILRHELITLPLRRMATYISFKKTA